LFRRWKDEDAVLLRLWQAVQFRLDQDSKRIFLLVAVVKKLPGLKMKARALLMAVSNLACVADMVGFFGCEKFSKKSGTCSCD
jgi:hypothetical protein